MLKNVLKSIREDMNMNKREFADYLGIKYTTYNGYETGSRNPDLDFIILIAKKCNLSADYILGLDSPKQKLHFYKLESSEYDLITKYRTLDLIGQEYIDFTINAEIQRKEKLREAQLRRLQAYSRALTPKIDNRKKNMATTE